jgi:hypothetical protein
MNNIKKTATKRENQLAKDVGGRRHAASGALWFRKSDASDTDFQYEDKFTEKDYYTLSITSLKKIESEAKKVNKLPVFRIGFIQHSNTQDYVVLRKKDCNCDIPSWEYHCNKSTKIYLEDLQRCQNTSNIEILMLSFGNDIYVVMMYRDFLLVKDRIIKGEELQWRAQSAVI